MKSIRFTLVLAAAALLAGCSDDLLTKTPVDAISDQVFWNTENDLAVYNNNLYDQARNDLEVPILLAHNQNFESHQVSYWYLDGFADNLAPNNARHARYQSVRAGKHVVPTNPEWMGYRAWGFVRSINYGLANYDKANIPQAVKDKYIAEARLLRGWFYADKVSKFGDVPWVEKPLNIDSEELFAARTPREEAMEKVLADLQFASQKLPENWNAGSPGRLNRWAALAVLSRVALFEGTWRKYHGGSNPNKWLQIAADAAKEIMDKGPYRLYSTGKPTTDYNASHRMMDLSANPEVIYWRKYKLGILTNHVQSYYSYTGGSTKDMVESYLATDGLPISLSPLYKGDETIEDVFVNRDPRLRQTILHPADAGYYKYHLDDNRSYPRVTGMSGGFISSTGYHVIKHYNADDMIGKAFNTGEHPGIILRFGEVLLNYAEAKAELGTLTQGDLDLSINKLRDRVGMPHLTLGNIPADPAFDQKGVSPLIQEIRRERRVELFEEGFRYDDLRRWKQGKVLEEKTLGIRWNDAAKARYTGANVKTAVAENGKVYIDPFGGTDYATPVFDEAKHYLWPIPLNVLAQNPNIKQNPGW